jgi:hypothetical protein
MWPLYAKRLAHSNAPILVGPFRGEVGFEVLYWLPWLAAFCAKYQINPERLLPISRGGAAAWYGAPQGIELYAMRTPQQVRVESRRHGAATGLLKQRTVSPWDRAVIADAAETLKLKRYHVLHPAWMYQDLEPFWLAQRGINWLLKRTQYTQPMPVLQLEGVTLPKEFVAVRFYSRYTFPPNDLTAGVARETIAQLARAHDVVLLTTGQHFDDHQDFRLKKRPSNVVALHELVQMTPEMNLSVQASVLSRALGFVGTYGGMSQLALRLTKPSVTFYQDWGGTALPHKHLADFLATSIGVPYHVQRIVDVPLAKLVLPPVVVQQNISAEKATEPPAAVVA